MVETVRFTVKVDKEIDEWLQGEVNNGRFGSKAQAVNTHLRQVHELEVMDFAVALMDLVSTHPEVAATLQKYIKGGTV